MSASPNTRTVLVVDDEDNVRSYFTLVLRSAGYDVIEARSGDIALWAADRKSPHLAVIDLIMPDMDALGLMCGLRSRWPGLPILVVSGRDHESALREGLIPADVPFLQKPFGPAILRHRVADLLGMAEPVRRGPHLRLPK